MHRVLISLGSNIDKENNLPQAMGLLGELCQIIAVSSVYETAPVGLLDQPSFFNAAVLIETELSPSQLKADVLETIEKQLKRRRTDDKNAPRTIDADITLYNEEILEYDHKDGRRRRVPDPDLLRFPHVAVPIAELAPELLHPETAEPLDAIARRLTVTTSQGNGRPPLWKRSDFKLTVE